MDGLACEGAHTRGGGGGQRHHKLEVCRLHHTPLGAKTVSAEAVLLSAFRMEGSAACTAASRVPKLPLLAITAHSRGGGERQGEGVEDVRYQFENATSRTDC